MSKSDLSASQLWAMSLAGIVTMMEANNINNLWEIGGWPDNENRRDWGRWVSKKLYGIESRDGLLQAVGFFTQKGQSAEMQAELSRLPREPSADNYAQRLLRDNASVIQRCGCMGWDIARAATIAGWAALGRYITEEEYWQLVKPMAQRAQQAYSSWRDYADGYELGRRYWAEGAEHKPTADAIAALLTDPVSPWVQLRWHTPLDQIQVSSAVETQSPDSSAADDVEVFPGQPVSRLTDYVQLMRSAQSGQITQAMTSLGLDMMAYSQVMQRWGQKMASDPSLAVKFSQLLTRG